MAKHKNKVDAPLDTSDIGQRQRLMAAAEKRLTSFEDEIAAGYQVIKKYDKTISIFGSARFRQNHPHYKLARQLSAELAQDGFTIVTGGGGGIMQAGNHGAHDVQRENVGFNIQLPNEQILNKFVSRRASYHYFFTRKVMLTFFADAYIYFPGGFGTLDELFEVLTLTQTKKMPRVPIILVGTKYWRAFDKFVKKQLLANRTISPGDEKLYVITDNFKTVRRIVNKSI